MAMSEAVKKRLSEATKERWKKIRANGGKWLGKRPGSTKPGHAAAKLGAQTRKTQRTKGAPLNGHAVETNGTPSDHAPVSFATKLVKQDVATLAIEGAKYRLAALDQERDLLMMFIKSNGRLTSNSKHGSWARRETT